MNKRKTYIKNKHNRNRNKTKKTRGGAFASFSKFFNKPTPEMIQPNKPLLINEKTPPRIQEKETLSIKASIKAKNSAELATAAATATYIGYAAVAGLSATGVGVPVAGALAAVLLIANSMSYMKIANIKLKTVLFDVLNIITHCNKLNSTILIIFNQFNSNLNKDIKIDPEIYDRLEEKLDLLMKYLIGLSTNSMIKILIKDENLKKFDKVGKIINDECKKRGMDDCKDDGEDENKPSSFKKVIQSVERGIDTSERVINRSVWAQYTINEVVKDLTIINGYFMLMKSQFDMLIQHHERNISDQIKKNIWSEIEKNDLYKSYLTLETKEIIESFSDTA